MDVKMAADEGSWRTNAFRQSVVAKIDEAIQRSGMPTTKNSMEMENHVYQKAKSKEEYLGFVARLILHVREMNSKKGGGMGGPGGAGGQAMPPDPINALQTLARQGTGNSQMMGIGVPPQAPPQIPASNLLQSLNQRPVQGLAGLPTLQNKMSEMGMGPGAQVGPMGQMPGQMQGQMPGQMRMQMPGQMGGQMPGQLPGQMPGQMQTQMQGQMPGQMPGQMQGQMPGQMPGQITHLAQMQGNENILMTSQNTGFPGPGPRNVTPTQFLRQSPSPSAPSPAGLTQAPNSNQMAASSPALVPSPGGQMTPMSVPQRSVGMAPSPSSSLNTPGPAVPTPSPCSLQEDQAYREKVRQLSKYIEPLRRMIARMGNDDVEKLSKMKKLLEILSNPSKRMPLETLLKCEVVLEKLDLKRQWRMKTNRLKTF